MRLAAGRGQRRDAATARDDALEATTQHISNTSTNRAHNIFVSPSSSSSIQRRTRPSFVARRDNRTRLSRVSRRRPRAPRYLFVLELPPQRHSHDGAVGCPRGRLFPVVRPPSEWATATTAATTPLTPPLLLSSSLVSPPLSSLLSPPLSSSLEPARARRAGHAAARVVARRLVRARGTEDGPAACVLCVTDGIAGVLRVTVAPRRCGRGGQRRPEIRSSRATPDIYITCIYLYI